MILVDAPDLTCAIMIAHMYCRPVSPNDLWAIYGTRC